MDDPPVDSLGDILALGLIHEALVGAMTRRNADEARDDEAYRAALARREVLREAVTAAMDRARGDAVAYPTLRRPPAPVGESQPGSTCSLSANTGLPAITVPAGFTADALPIGLELLGRLLADARLVAIAYAYEQAVRPRSSGSWGVSSTWSCSRAASPPGRGGRAFPRRAGRRTTRARWPLRPVERSARVAEPLDTNVLVRYLVEDPADSSPRFQRVTFLTPPLDFRNMAPAVAVPGWRS